MGTKNCDGNQCHKPIYSGLATLYKNKAIWLALPSPMTIINELECLVATFL